MSGRTIVEMADHPSRAFKVQTTVFLPQSRNTVVKLGRGERLFVLTDKGLDEAPQTGPDEINICTEHFGCWPVVAIKVRQTHLGRWRSVQPDDCKRMMKRVRTALAQSTPHLDTMGDKL